MHPSLFYFQYLHSVYIFIYVCIGNLRRSISFEYDYLIVAPWHKTSPRVWSILIIGRLNETFKLTLPIWYVQMKNNRSIISSSINKDFSFEKVSSVLLFSGRSDLNDMWIWLFNVCFKYLTKSVYNGFIATIQKYLIQIDIRVKINISIECLFF